MLLGNLNDREAVVHSVLLLFVQTLVQSKVGDLWISSKPRKDEEVTKTTTRDSTDIILAVGNMAVLYVTPTCVTEEEFQDAFQENNSCQHTGQQRTFCQKREKSPYLFLKGAMHLTFSLILSSQQTDYTLEYLINIPFGL